MHTHGTVSTVVDTDLTPESAGAVFPSASVPRPSATMSLFRPWVPLIWTFHVNTVT